VTFAPLPQDWSAFLALLGQVALLVWAYMTLWFLVALAIRKNDIADVAWGLGFIVIAWWLLATADPKPPRLWIAAVLVTVWGVRLAWHIGSRRRGKPEDYRYATWRREWGRWFVPRTYLQVFVLQGVFMVLIALPLVVLAADTPPALPTMFAAIPIALWGLGFAFETVGDAQLATFLRDPANRGHVMDRGLWRYTRHPNYFGESLQWWAIWMLTLGVPGWLVASIGPLTITLLLRYVSGVPLLERKRAGQPEWEAYKARTSAMIPLPPRRT
jgi:steroid 5-alpha reductase family enzyme